MATYEDLVEEIIIIILDVRVIEGDIRDIPNDGDSQVYEAVETLAANPTVRANLVRRVSEAEEAGLVFALPSTEELAHVREKRLAR